MMAPRYGIQFYPCGQIYYFTSPDMALSLGTPVVVDTGHGENLGQIIKIIDAAPAGPVSDFPSPHEEEGLGADASGAAGGLSGKPDMAGSGFEETDGENTAPEESRDNGEDAGESYSAGDEVAEGAEERRGSGGEALAEAAQEDPCEDSGSGDEHSECEGQEISEILSEALNPDSPKLTAIRRVAAPRDLERAEQNISFAAKAGKYCKDCAVEHRLDMKLVHTEVSLDGGKLIFFFTAPGRIDFRELVKALARNFHARIELRQIGVRHETQIVGAIGNCGMVCCCRRYMRKFAPVTIKMAKEQGLFLNPVKISGTCGRLLCCLSFEQHNYEEFHGRCPKLGKKYETDKGVFKVLRASLFRNSLTLLPEMGDELEVTLEEWRDMHPARFDNSRRQREEKEARGGGAAPSEREGDARERGGRDDNERPASERGGNERGGRRRPTPGGRDAPAAFSERSDDGRGGAPRAEPSPDEKILRPAAKPEEPRDGEKAKEIVKAGREDANEKRSAAAGLSRFLAAASGDDDEDEPKQDG